MNAKMKTSTSTSERHHQKASKSSILLTSDENEQVFGLLGRKNQSLCTSVVQIFRTEPSAHSAWKKKYTAVLCFIKDSSKKSYFMRAYCLIRNELVWEHEVYENMKVYRTKPYLITFEGENGHVAFNFASDEECENFHHVTESIIENRNRKRQERRNRPKVPPTTPGGTSKQKPIDLTDTGEVQLRNKPSTVNTVQLTTGTSQQPKPNFSNVFGSSKDKKKTARKVIYKKDISMPTNFIHVSHVGWDAEKGFDLTGNENDEVLKSFFNKAGVSEQQLNDRDTRAFIYDFVQNHNVIASVKSERVEKPKAPAPPPVPKREINQNGQQRMAPPPPPPPVRQSAQQRTVPNRSVNVASPSLAPPPPPPPPPMPSTPLPPPMPSMPSSPPTSVPKNEIPIVDDGRSALMDSIKKGTVLKKVEPTSLSTGSGDDARSNLMKEIQHGTTLRPVGDRELPPSNRDSGGGSDGTDALADALRRALQARMEATHSSSDSDSDSDNDNDNDDWED